MTLTAANVRVGVTGSVHMAPTGTAVPTIAGEALNAAFVDVGYIGEDGVSQSISTTTNDIKAWQNGDIVRRVQTEHDLTYTFAMIETNAASLELYYGNYAHGPGGDSGQVDIDGSQGFRGAFVFKVTDDTDLIWVVIPDGQVTDRGDLVYQNGDAVAHEVTITCYPDGSGVKATLLFDTEGAS